MALDVMILVFWMLSCKPAFSFSSFTFISSVQLLSRVWLCNPMDCSMPGSPVHHQLPKFAQAHVHCVGDAIQPSYPLLPPSRPSVNISQYPGLFQCVSSSHQVAKVLEFSISPSNEYSQLISFRIDRFDLLGLSRAFSNSTTVQKQRFFGT